MYDPSRDYNLHKAEIDKSIQDVVLSGKFINGPQVKELEVELEKYVGSRAITCANGTDALFIALKALDIGPLDEVLTVGLTWISSAEVISMTGAVPVWCEIDKNTFCLDPISMESKITNKTKAVICVSLYGYIPDYKTIQNICKKHNIFLIEDGAQSFGAQRDGYKSCSCEYTDIATTSFFPTKPLGCFGDGGCIFTRNVDLGNKIYAIKNHGGIERFKHKYIGMNSRLDTIQASILLAKLKYFDSTLVERNLCAKKYSELLSPYLKVPNNDIEIHAFAQYSLICKDQRERDKLVSVLKENGVNVAIFYPIPLYKQECFNTITSLPITDDICTRVLNLPCYHHVTEKEIIFIVEIIKNNLV